MDVETSSFFRRISSVHGWLLFRLKVGTEGHRVYSLILADLDSEMLKSSVLSRVDV